MNVHIVGSGPAREAIAAALEDVECAVVDASPEELSEASLGVVIDDVGAAAFEQADDAAREGDASWFSLEIGGIGGQPIDGVDAAITGFGPDSPCYSCLRLRASARTAAESVGDDGGDGNPTAVRDETTDEGGVETDGGEEAAAQKPAAASVDRATVRLAGAIAGREIASVVEDDAPIGGTVVELPYTRRSLLPVPGCSCDDERDRTIDRTHEDVPLEETLARADRSLDERLGLVRSVGEVESYPVPYYLAAVCDTAGFSDARAPAHAAGVDPDWDLAFVKGIGEALERYCAAVYRDDDFVIAAEEDVERPVTPDAFVRPEGAPPYNPDAEIRWVEGENLATGEPAHLPASMVHFPPSPAEPRFTPAITTGLGLGTSTVQALVSGLTEVIERDATMLAWYSTFEPFELHVEDETYDALVRRARAEHLWVTPLLVTQDVDVPVVTTVVHRSGEWPRFAVGSAADLDPVVAARSALTEGLQNWMELAGMGREEATEATGKIGHYADAPEPAKAMIDADGPIPVESVGPDPVPRGEDALDALIQRVVDAGMTPYAARTTTPDVESLGFEAVRVVVPSAQPLFTQIPFFGERAESVPDDLGFEARLDRPFHPYP